ncbi:hypothetical protein [Bacillus pseudomycoides]|uniref:hypothetical protein n=1 Tax=Bacillus pseudomycoides TaxID=64104 RepID=UPI003D656DC2
MHYKFSFYLILFIAICLILTSLFRKKVPSTKLQFLTHVLLYLIEIITATTIITYFIEKFEAISTNLSLLAVLRNYVFSYTIYQLFLLITFKLKDSLDVDAYTAIKNLIDKYQIFAEFDKKIPDEDLKEVNEKVNNSRMVFNKEQRIYTQKILTMVEAYNSGKIDVKDFRFALKQESREIDIQTKIISYGWMNSILLRIFK